MKAIAIALLLMFGALPALAGSWDRNQAVLPGQPRTYSFTTSDTADSSIISAAACGTMIAGFEAATGGEATVYACSDSSCTSSEAIFTFTADDANPSAIILGWKFVKVDSVTAPSSGTAAVTLSCGQNVSGGSGGGGGASSSLVLEGSTNDDFETTVDAIDPTADRAINFPDAAGTVALTSALADMGLTADSNNDDSDACFLFRSGAGPTTFGSWCETSGISAAAVAIDPSTSPKTEFEDIDVLGSLELVGSIHVDATDTTEDSVDSTMNFYTMLNAVDAAETLSASLTTTYFQIGAGAGVRLSQDGDGALTLLGQGNGSDEDLTINLDDTSNEVTLTSSTGVATINHPDASIPGADIKSGEITPTQTSAALETQTCTIPLVADTSGALTHVDRIARCYIPVASTLTRVFCHSGQANTVTVDVFERTETAPQTGTTSLLSAAIACDADSINATISDSAIAADSFLVLDVTAESLAAGEFGVAVFEWTVN